MDVNAHVSKESIGALIRTVDQIIVGQIHARPNKRLKDEMNHVSDRFVAVTDARVYDVDGATLLYETTFMLIANTHVVSLTPTSAITNYGQTGWTAAILAPRAERAS